MTEVGYVVVKYGGTSLESPEKITAAARALVGRAARGERLVAVVSAMGHTTDDLVRLCEACGDGADSDEAAVVLAAGEQVAAGLVASAIARAGGKARSYLAWQLPFVTDATGRRILSVEADALSEDVADGIIPVVAGYQGVDLKGRLTTLGRGGSDTTAVAIAAALKAQHCEIRTDVRGVFGKDPRLHPRASMFTEMTYEHMERLAAAGAQILNLDAARLAAEHDMPLWIGAAFGDQPGTWITKNGGALSGFASGGLS